MRFDKFDMHIHTHITVLDDAWMYMSRAGGRENGPNNAKGVSIVASGENYRILRSLHTRGYQALQEVMIHYRADHAEEVLDSKAKAG